MDNYGTPSGFSVTLHVYHGRNRGYYNGTPSRFSEALHVYHGRNRGYYNGTLSGLGIADTVAALQRSPLYHGETVPINMVDYNGTPSGFSVMLHVYHGRNRGYYNGTPSGLGIADTGTTLLRAPHYHGLTVRIIIVDNYGTPSGFSVALHVYHGRDRGYYNGTPSGFSVALPVNHGRDRGYYNETLSGLGIADTVAALQRSPLYHGETVPINMVDYNGTPSGFSVTLHVYHGRNRGYYNGTLSGLGIADTVAALQRSPLYHGETVPINMVDYNGTPSGFSVTLHVYHGRNRGYYNGTLSGLGIADTVAALQRSPLYHGETVPINMVDYNGTPSGFSVMLHVYHGRNRGYYNGTPSGFSVALHVYHGRDRGYYNGTLSGLGIPDTGTTLLRAPHYHGATVE